MMKKYLGLAFVATLLLASQGVEAFQMRDTDGNVLTKGYDVRLGKDKNLWWGVGIKFNSFPGGWVIPNGKGEWRLYKMGNNLYVSNVADLKALLESSTAAKDIKDKFDLNWVRYVKSIRPTAHVYLITWGNGEPVPMSDQAHLEGNNPTEIKITFTISL